MVSEALASPREVHLWHVDLEHDWGPWVLSLSPQEAAHAARFAAAHAARQFRHGRAALRMLLGRYCGCAANEVVLRTGPHGKPALADPARATALHFNVSHSGSRALIALASSPVGVDIEAVGRRGIEVDELLDLVCHPEERACLAAMAPAPRQAAFYRLWTRKEACCKALGLGLQLPLASLNVHPHRPGPVELRMDEGPSRATWWVHDVAAADSCAASLCTTHADLRLQHREALP